jgi:hypothetical protein
MRGGRAVLSASSAEGADAGVVHAARADDFDAAAGVAAAEVVVE